MGGGKHRASTSNRATTPTPPKRIHTPATPTQAGTTHPPPRHSCAPTVIPAQAGTAQPPHPYSPRHPTPTPPSPIHPSPLLGGRLGGGWEAPSVHQRPSNRATTPTPPKRIHTPATPAQAGTTHPHPVIPAPPSVIPAQAGTSAGRNRATPTSLLTPPPHTHPPFPNSSLPPFRGEVRWGVRGTERPPATEQPPPLPQNASTLPSPPRRQEPNPQLKPTAPSDYR